MKVTLSEPEIEIDVPEDFESEPVPSAASIGTFDGLHRGHILVIATLLQLCRRNRLRPLVFSFTRHPLALIRPDRVPPTLLSPQRRDAMLEVMGVVPVDVDFTENVRHLTCEEWMRLLRDHFGVRKIVVGYDNTFGSDGRTMSREALLNTARSLGIEPIEAPLSEGASSSAARRALAEGDVSKASRILGYPYILYGKVGKGEQLGRQIGFPTANLIPEADAAVPGRGVYAAQAIIEEKEYPAMVNIGNRPTIGEGLATTIEAHIIDFSGDLYGKPLALRFMKKLRDERCFRSLEELSSQLQKDKAETLSLFGI